MEAFVQRGNLDSSRSRDRQLRVGLIALAMALVAAAFLDRGGGSAAMGIPAGYRTLVFLPFFVAAYGVLAAFYETCGFYALAGKRHTTDGAEPVADRAELASQRRTGAMVVVASGLVAAGATALFVIAGS